MLNHNVDSGWVESDGEPRWRSTSAALDRITGADIYWREGANKALVAHLERGTPIAVIRHYPQHKRWSLNIEGFQFWQDVAVLGRPTWAGPLGFDTKSEAKRIAADVIKQAGGTIRRKLP